LPDQAELCARHPQVEFHFGQRRRHGHHRFAGGRVQVWLTWLQHDDLECRAAIISIVAPMACA
jgi:hypothetical protein